MASPTRETTRPVLSATRARQGRTGRHMFWVLVFGLILVVLGFVAAYTWQSDDLSSANTNDGPSSRSAEFNAPEPAPIQGGIQGNNAPDSVAPAGGAQPNPSSPQ